MVADDVKFDTTTKRIARYVIGLDPEEITIPSRHVMTSRVVDAVGCALGALDSPPGTVSRSLAAGAGVATGVSVIGLSQRTTPELAAFANGCLVRYLDFNDTYHTEGGGHPSDMLPAILAAAELTGCSGSETLTGLHVAYEVFAALADAVPMRDKGWDYGAFLSIATAAGVSRVLELEEAGVCNAISLSVTPNMPLFVTRTGELSNWKGCASAYAAMSALFAVRLSQAGITGPPRPFEGKFGMWEQATGPFALDHIGSLLEGRSAVERTSCKLRPSDFETQIPSEVFIDLHNQGTRLDDIASIAVSTYYLAWDLIGGGQGDYDEKWNPKRRETADHSLPYVIAVALADGRVDKSSFSPKRLTDPALRPFMQSITVAEDTEITRSWRTSPAYDFEVKYRDGRLLQIHIDRPQGHYLRPLTDDQISDKFRANASSALAPDAIDELLTTLWGLDQLDDQSGVMAFLRDITPTSN